MPSLVAGHGSARIYLRREAVIPAAQLARTAAFTVLLLLSPLFVIIAGLIVISSRGPVLIKRPVGLCNGQFAYVTEFRTWPPFDPAVSEGDHCAAKSRTLIGRVLHLTALSRLPRLMDVSAGGAKAR